MVSVEVGLLIGSVSHSEVMVLISGGDRLIGRVLGTSFLSALGIILGGITGSGDGIWFSCDIADPRKFGVQWKIIIRSARIINLCHDYSGVLDHKRIYCRLFKGVAVVAYRIKLGVN